MATPKKQPYKHKQPDSHLNNGQAQKHAQTHDKSDTPDELQYSVSHDDVAKLLSKRFIGLNVFFILMLVLGGAILWVGLKTATQIQEYRQDYKGLQHLKQEYRHLQVEHQRLLIEQQTFSATPQIASRAVSELNMHFPAFKDKMIVQPQAIVKNERIIIRTDINNDGNKDVGDNQ